MDSIKAIEAARRFSELVLQEFKPVQIYLYGSYAKGTAREESDIDIAVVFDELNDEWLENEKRLWRLAWMVSDYIEPVALELKHDRSGFLAHIRSYATPVYSQTALNKD